MLKDNTGLVEETETMGMLKDETKLFFYEHKHCGHIKDNTGFMLEKIKPLRVDQTSFV